MPSPHPQRLPEDLAHCAPGPRLGSLLAGIDPARLTGPDCVAVLQAWHRQVAYAQACFMEAVVQVGLCRPAPDGVVSRDVRPCWQGADEIRAALALTRGAADRQLGLAWDLQSRLPQVHQALSQGRIDQPRARVFSEWTTDLETPQAERICAMLLPKAGALTTGQLIDQIKRMIIAIDPEWAARRYTRAVGERRVVGHLNPDGTANLSGLDLPADQAASATANIEALARRVKRAGDHRPIDHIRADLYLGLLDGSFTGCDERQIIAHLLSQVRQPADPGPAAPQPDEPRPATHQPTGPRSATPQPDERPPDEPRPGEPPYDRARERTSGQTRPGTEHHGSASADTREATNQPDPAHPTGPSSNDHTEPTDSADPPAAAGPAEPTGGSNPPGAADTAASTARTEPCSPSGHPSPAHPAEPTAASDPASPPESADPADPVDPADPATPADPTAASSPVGPTDPVGSAEDPDHGGGVPRSLTGLGVGPRAGVELRVELSTLLGLDRHPAELAGWGYIHAEAARSIASAQTGAQWRYTVCDDHGVLLHDGLITTRPAGFPPRSPRPGGIIEIRIPLTLLRRLFTDPRLHPPWAKIITGIVRDIDISAASALDHGASDHEAPDGVAPDGESGFRSSALGGRPSGPVTGSDGGPPGGPVPGGERRFPDARTRRHVQVRDQRCQFPGCRMPARDTDTDHIRQWIGGGPSLDRNLVSLCRHDHRIKDEGGWRLSRVSDSLLRWTSRLGLTYTIRRPSVIIPLPDPLPGRRSARAVATAPSPLASTTTQQSDPAPAAEPEVADTGGTRREPPATPPQESPIWLRSAHSGRHNGDETRPSQRATLIDTEEDDVPF